MLECMKCFLNLSERKRRKELDRIIEKGAVGGKLTPEERAFLHHETMKHVSYRKDTIEDLRKSLEHEKKYGPGSVVFLPNGIMNPETGKPVITIAEYLRVLEREEAEEQAQKGMVNDMSKGCSGNTHSTAELNHYANQHNPNNDAYKAAADNHANQCNPNHSEYKK